MVHAEDVEVEAGVEDLGGIPVGNVEAGCHPCAVEHGGQQAKAGGGGCVGGKGPHLGCKGAEAGLLAVAGATLVVGLVCLLGSGTSTLTGHVVADAVRAGEVDAIGQGSEAPHDGMQIGEPSWCAHRVGEKWEEVPQVEGVDVCVLHDVPECKGEVRVGHVGQAVPRGMGEGRGLPGAGQVRPDRVAAHGPKEQSLLVIRDAVVDDLRQLWGTGD